MQSRGAAPWPRTLQGAASPGSHYGAGPGATGAGLRGSRRAWPVWDGEEPASFSRETSSAGVLAGRGRGNGRAHRASARSCSRFNELYSNELRAPGDSQGGVPLGLFPLWVCPLSSWAMQGAELCVWEYPRLTALQAELVWGSTALSSQGQGFILSPPLPMAPGLGEGLQPLSQAVATIPWATSAPTTVGEYGMGLRVVWPWCWVMLG